MSLLPPKNAQEAKFQYCNYGHGPEFKDFQDCMARYDEVFPSDKTVRPAQPGSAPPKKKINNAKIATIGGLGLAGYSIYKIPKLPDALPNERTLAIAGVVGGSALYAWGMQLGSLSGSGPSEDQRKTGTAGLYILLSSAGYSFSRVLFRQSPKVSLVAGILVAGAAALYLSRNKQTDSSIPDSSTPKK